MYFSKFGTGFQKLSLYYSYFINTNSHYNLTYSVSLAIHTVI